MKSIWLVVIVISVALAKAETCGFGYELIMTVLETMQSNGSELDRDLRSVGTNVNQLIDGQRLSKSTVQNHYEHIEQDLRSVGTNVNQLIDGQRLSMSVLETLQSNSRSLDRDLRSVGTNVNQLIDGQRLSKSTVQNHYEHIEQDLRSVATKMEILVDHTKTVVTKLDQLIDLIAEGEPSRCPENAADGVYKLKPAYSSIPPFSVYCANGWIEIQSRWTGRLDFNRTWASYREGFGDIQGEHWIGLEKMHQITRVGSYELRVVLSNFEGVVKRANYKGFKISDANNDYQLNLENFVEGDAGDSFMYHNKMKFSAVDRDNDPDKGSCAMTYKSGWWFKDCYHSNLNGLYGKGKNSSTMSWWHFNQKHDSLKSTRMLIRRV